MKILKEYIELVVESERRTGYSWADDYNVTDYRQYRPDGSGHDRIRWGSVRKHPSTYYLENFPVYVVFANDSIVHVSLDHDTSQDAVEQLENNPDIDAEIESSKLSSSNLGIELYEDPAHLGEGNPDLWYVISNRGDYPDIRSVHKSANEAQQKAQEWLEGEVHDWLKSHLGRSDRSRTPEEEEEFIRDYHRDTWYVLPGGTGPVDWEVRSVWG